MNWINPAVVALQNYARITRLTQDQKNLNQEVIELWENADASRNNPRELIRLFGDGFAKYTLLPESFKKRTSVYAFNALMEVGQIANQNKIRVDFDTTGAIFY